MGSTPSSNFRQRLSQSIIGTKQLNVEGTDSGPPFFIHTRNLAGCSPSLTHEVGLRIRSVGKPSPKDSWSVAYRAQLGVQSSRKDCIAFSKQNFGSQCHSTSQHAQCYAHMRRPEPPGSGTTGRNVAEKITCYRGRPLYFDATVWSFQPIDFTGLTSA